MLKKIEEYDIILIDEVGNELKDEERRSIKLHKLSEENIKPFVNFSEDLMNLLRGNTHFRLNEIEIGISISNTGKFSIISGNHNPSIKMKIVRRN